MTIWTVSCLDDEERFGPCNRVCGSYTSRGKAIDECVDWMLERIGALPEVAWAFANDENHDGMEAFFEERKKTGRMVVRSGVSKKLRARLREALGADGCYNVYDGMNGFCFNVDENDVEGEVWSAVTWGEDCGDDDPEFTTPWPETFTTKEAAVRSFLSYALDLWKSHGHGHPDVLETMIRSDLDADGLCRVDLGDGSAVNYALYREDAANVKGWGDDTKREHGRRAAK